MNDKYTILKREFLSDNGCYLTTYCHKKTKSLVIYIELDEESLSSLVMVRTPNYNDKGIYHIIEHCVLSGSKKYNCKDPFKEIEKRSLSSYMNAITFADKTIFPFTTVNKTDFYNVLDVYLDGIFNPLFLDNKEIIAKEGIHFEFQNGKIIPNGIVYNEMKGIEGEALTRVNLLARKALYKNSAYAYFSGGLTKEIKKVRSEEISDAYYKTYFPSNMAFIVSGPVDITRYLTVLDTYIAKYSFKEPVKFNYANIELKKHQNKLKLLDDNPNILAFSFKLPFINDPKGLLALSILNYLLIDIEGAKLKIKLEENGVRGNLYTDIDDSYNPMCQIILEFDDKYTKKASKLIKDFLKNDAPSLIDRKRIKSTIEYFRFGASEEDYDSLPKGLALAISLTNDLLYNDMSYERIRRKSLYDELDEEINTNYFLEILNQAYIKNNNYVITKARPHLKKLKTGNFKPSLKEVKALQAKLNNYLKSIDDLSNLKGIPLDAISKNPINYPYEINNNSTFIKNDKNDIYYIKLMFDISDFSLDEIALASILSHNLAIFKMKDLTCDEFMIKANQIGGGITTEIAFYTDRVTKKIRRYFTCDMSFFLKRYNDNIELLKKMLLETLFDNDDVLSVIETLRIELTSDNNYFKERIYKLDGLKSYNQIGFFLDATQGTLFLKNLNKLIENENRSTILKNLLGKILDKKRMQVASYAPSNINERVVNDIKLDFKADMIKSYDLSPDFKSKGLIMKGISSNMLVIPTGKKSPVAFILTRIIEDYLWKAIRNENGAYHIQAYVDTNGNIIMYSRQDPNLLRTYQIMEKSIDAILNMKLTAEEIKDYIISYFSATTSVLSAYDTFNLVLRMIFENYDYATRKNNRMGILNVTEKEIKDYALYIKGELKKAIKISIYDGEIIRKMNLFDEIKEIK